LSATEPSLPSPEALYDEAPCGLVVTGADGVILRANATLCRWIGYSKEELVGLRRVQDLLSVGGKIFHQTHWAPLLQLQGSIAEVKLEIIHRDGHSIPMLMNAIRREHTSGVHNELSLTIATDRHKYEQELVRAKKIAEESLAKQLEIENELKISQEKLRVTMMEAEKRATFSEQMVGIVSHDLRNPLSAIKMAAHLLGRDELRSNKLRVLGNLVQSADRAQRLIADLLDFTSARIGRGLSVQRSSVELHELVAHCVEELSLAFPGRSLKHQSDGLGACAVDSDRLVQLVGNLVANAMTYGDTDRPVTVKSAIREKTFFVSVHNWGSVIPLEILPQLFEPMVRGGAKDGLGVGLGLYIVSEIAKAHGGKVQVESSADDGTTVCAIFLRDLIDK
jgi:sigma-B regulation protein RsbU (phosphoserine phosphatase)